MATKQWIFLSAFLLLCFRSECQVAVLHISDANSQNDYCLVYNSSWSNISSTLSDAVKYSLLNMTGSLLCDAGSLKPDSLIGKAVFVKRGNCTFKQKALVAQKLGAAALIITSVDSMRISMPNDTDPSELKIPIGMMRYQDFLYAQRVITGEAQVQLYSPLVPEFDASIIIMLVLALFTVAMGGLWSGAVERAKQCDAALSGGGDGTDSGELSLYSPVKVLLFVLLMCAMLVMMYFFYKYLVYVIIVIFCLASTMGLYHCFEALLDVVGCSKLSVSCGERSCSVRNLLLAAVCITLTVVWVVYRNEDRWIWILQDLLGVAFCLNFMKTITVSNYKICVILLSLLLVYDVFFVFITPLLTPNGESIMVQVALGPGAGEKGSGDFEIPADPSPSYEKLPVVMRIPRFSVWTQNLCEMQFSILGYGDIIVPGLLVAYCHRFDVLVGNSNKIYYICCTIAYCLGLVLTFIVMFVSRMGQPALLYLVPFTLITSGVLAWRRKQFRQFWAGTMYEVLDESQEPLIPDGDTKRPSAVRKC